MPNIHFYRYIEFSHAICRIILWGFNLHYAHRRDDSAFFLTDQSCWSFSFCPLKLTYLFFRLILHIFLLTIYTGVPIQTPDSLTLWINYRWWHKINNLVIFIQKLVLFFKHKQFCFHSVNNFSHYTQAVLGERNECNRSKANHFKARATDLFHPVQLKAEGLCQRN